MRSARSNTTTSCPTRVSCWAAASPAGPEPTTATFLPGAGLRLLRRHPALVPRPVDDLDLDLLDRDGVGVDRQHARGLARGGAERAGELGEVVGGVQPLDGLAPVVAVDQVVPLRDEVAQRAALVAERDAAVHAAAGLRLQVGAREVLVDLAPVPQPQVDRPAHGQLPRGGQEPLGVTHVRASMIASFTSRPSRSRRLAGLEHPLEVLRHDLAEPVDRVVPLGEQLLRHRRLGLGEVPLDGVAQERAVVVVERVDVDHLRVDPALRAGRARRRRRRTCPPRSCARSGRARRPAAGHVLAAVVADALDDGQRAGVAHAEPLADDAAHEDLAGRGPVEDHVARDDVLLGLERRRRVGRSVSRPPERPLPK